MKRILLAAITAALAIAPASAVTIDFESAPAGPLTSLYSGLGVTFSNATVETFPLAGMSGTHAIRSTSGGYAFGASHAVVATFSSGMSSVSINGIDVGAAGLRIDAYDAATGGTLVDFDTAFGPGVGVGYFFTVSAAASSIMRVEVYQVTAGLGGDGILLDDLTFTEGTGTVPDSTTTLPLFAAALAGLVALRRNRR